jgi:hypothetical protein
LAIGFTIGDSYCAVGNTKKTEIVYDNRLCPDCDQDLLSIEVMIEVSMDSRLQIVETQEYSEQP